MLSYGANVKSGPVFVQNPHLLQKTRKLCYRKDDRAMRPMYESRENCMQAQLSKNLHITILSLFGGEIIFEEFLPV